MSELQFENLITGKPHVSFSEVKEWSECSWRHKLHHIEKIDNQKPSEILDFGTSAHAGCENFLNSGTMDVTVAQNMLKQLWLEHAHPHETLTSALENIEAILLELPQYLNETFPDWQPVDAEHQLYEQLEKFPQHAFKGFIDCIIKVPTKNGKKWKYWIIDFKTTNWGWNAEKRSDKMIQSQLVLYKNFYSKKLNIDPKDIQCGFLLLKKVAKQGKRCEFIKVSVGDLTTERSIKVVNNMISAVKKGIALKNRNACKWCEFKNTEWCK